MGIIDNEATSNFSPEAERKLVRKIDWLLMPVLTIAFGLQYWDKAVLGSAAVFGIIKDLHLSVSLPVLWWVAPNPLC